MSFLHDQYHSENLNFATRRALLRTPAEKPRQFTPRAIRRPGGACVNSAQPGGLGPHADPLAAWMGHDLPGFIERIRRRKARGAKGRGAGFSRHSPPQAGVGADVIA